MPYKYSYKDWEEGKINWNSIESNKYIENYISEECKHKIRKRQQEILENESQKLTEKYISIYNLKRRRDTNRNVTLNKLLKTIDNLFNGDVNSFDDTVVLDEEQAMTESLPIEFHRKSVPPLNWVSFSKKDIIGIQEAYTTFCNSEQWNIESVETPERLELWKHIGFRYNVFSKAYHNFSVRLRQYDGVVYNTFNSDIDEFKLARFRVDLIKGNLISKETDRELFIRVFKGYYLLKSERFNWLKNLNCLRYLIVSLDKELHFSNEYGKWQTAVNCFTKGYMEINPDSLRKATKILNYPEEKKQIDTIISSLK